MILTFRATGGATPVPNDLPYGSGRMSAARSLIAEKFASSSAAFSAKDLRSALTADGHDVGLATIYRALAALERSGYVTRVGALDDSAVYARCEVEGHHHHLVCTNCRGVEHTACPIEETAFEATSVAGSTVIAHEIELYGVCAQCKQEGGSCVSHTHS
ncbi:MAG: transcriptional repressor [Actinobacteria bacterium]|nr:transcriptional repressor [Actinomycetota bacterium]